MPRVSSASRITRRSTFGGDLHNGLWRAIYRIQLDAPRAVGVLANSPEYLAPESDIPRTFVGNYSPYRPTAGPDTVLPLIVFP